MKNELTYTQAFAELETLVEELEDGSVELEELATKIKQATGLIEICEMKLRKIESDTEDAAKTATN
jgi:exodeoxyribonuclease VII small subunit